MRGHGGWITKILVGERKINDERSEEFLVTASRDNSVMIWDITPKKQSDGDDEEWGLPRKVLKGHSHFVQDIALSQDSKFLLSASWDGTLRLWDTVKGNTTKRFVSHNKDVLTVAFSPDNRQIASGGRDNFIKIWNTVGDCKYTVEQNGHSDWVSAARFSPDTKTPLIVTAGWDKTIKVWDSQTMQLKNTFVGHSSQINAIAMAPTGNLMASGGHDGKVLIWQIADGTHVKTIQLDAPVNDLAISSQRFWVAVGTDTHTIVYDLSTDERVMEYEPRRFEEQATKGKQPKTFATTSVAWSKNGNLLYAGYADHNVRVFELETEE